ncbi:MAG: hypothetical protein CVU39_12700 [Chloroflexi bacterium HGW-Chloroflexi-10]|nr:MAG: hypothetical protein CVU39_12700 [Chloroflexi bacterium HGW-Chloroflexi-10]
MQDILYANLWMESGIRYPESGNIGLLGLDTCFSFLLTNIFSHVIIITVGSGGYKSDEKIRNRGRFAWASKCRDLVYKKGT